MTKFRIISDIHLDVNYQDGDDFIINNKDGAVTLVAGDISGSKRDVDVWLEGNGFDEENPCIFVEGNHIVYNDEGRTIDDLISEYKESYKELPVRFLENGYQELSDGTIVVGATLWTNFSLYSKSNDDVKIAMSMANIGMNDYRWGIISDGKVVSGVRRMTPEDTLFFFNKSFNFISETADKFKDRKIVVLTHHAPSEKSIKGFSGKFLNAAYASNLEDFIVKYPNIALWVHGHTHQKVDYMIGNCRVVCNPRGYESYGEKTGYSRNMIVEI